MVVLDFEEGAIFCRSLVVLCRRHMNYMEF